MRIFKYENAESEAPPKKEKPRVLEKWVHEEEQLKIQIIREREEALERMRRPRDLPRLRF